MGKKGRSRLKTNTVSRTIIEFEPETPKRVFTRLGFLFDVVERAREKNNLQARNILRSELLYDDVESQKQGYYYTNAHGDIVEIKDKAGQTLNKYEYDLWGNVESKQETMSNPFLYAGEIFDEESGLIYLRARYYDPNDGRFITEDTYKGQVDNPLSLNRYTYVSNNPFRYADPSGHIPTPMEAAEMAGHIYSQSGDFSGGWKFNYAINGGDNMVMGVYSRVKANGTTEYALVNKGTTASSLSDWKNNIEQHFGSLEDMKASIENSKEFVMNHSNNEITMAGHSKGGANAVVANKNSIIFNPATVNLKAYGIISSNYSASMTTFIVEGDILNSIEVGFSKPIDKVVYLPQQYRGHWSEFWQTNAIDRIKNHLMGAVQKALKEAEYK
ncbi:RHS repeat domain-containing protein [Brevibacillus laterosporus]|uniref:RHS repeat domain-containing protein n=1 Tax=Brevibacillus laterosporus TaxID=1465 RepID=UPI003D213946